MDDIDIKNLLEKLGKEQTANIGKLFKQLKQPGLSDTEIKRLNKEIKTETDLIKQKIKIEKEEIAAIEKYTDVLSDQSKAARSVTENLYKMYKGLGYNTTQAQKLADKTIATGETIGKLGAAAKQGSGKIDDFTAAFKGRLGGIGDIVSLVGTGLQTNVDTFRTLSNVGAAFGQDLVTLRETAASAGLPIEDFTKLIKDNSQSLAQLYGSSTQGAIAFSNLSRDFRTANIDFLAPLGLTVSELNDTLLTTLNIQRITGNFDRNDTQAQTQAAKGLIIEIDKLAKLTGQQRTELTKQMERQMANARFQAFLTMQTQETGDRLRTFAAGLSGIANDPQFETALLDLIANAGQPVTEIGRQLVNNVREAPQIISQLNSGLIDNQQALELFRDASLRASQANARVAATGQVAFLDTFFPAVNRVGRTTMNLADVNNEAAKRQSTLTNELTKFENSSKALSASFQSLETGFFANLGGALGIGVGVVSKGMTTVASGINNLNSTSKALLYVGTSLSSYVANKAAQTAVVFGGTYSALIAAGLGKGSLMSNLTTAMGGKRAMNKTMKSGKNFLKGPGPIGIGAGMALDVAGGLSGNETVDKALDILSYTAYGAGIGSYIPGVGTAVGAGVGTVAGLAKALFDSVPSRAVGTFGATGMPFEPKTSLMKIHAGETVKTAREVSNDSMSQEQLMLGVTKMTSSMSDYVNIARQQLESSKQQEKLLNTMISVDMENTKYTKLTANRVSSNKGNLIG
jgi:hypothetical protein